MKTVYFELFGKKMKVKVEAVTDEEARYIVSGHIINKIKWGKIEGDDFEAVKDIFKKAGLNI